MNKFICFVIASTFMISFPYAQIIDPKEKTKEGAENRVNTNLEEGINKSLDKTEEGIKNLFRKKEKQPDKVKKEPSESNMTNRESVPVNPENSNSEKPSTLFKAYNNFDFVSGEKIIFEDHFESSPDGEFPDHWNLINGQGVMNKTSGESSFVLTDGNYAIVEPAMKIKSYLGNSFTAELDYNVSNGENGILIFLPTAEKDGYSISINSNGEVSTNYFEHNLSANYPGTFDHSKWHHVSLAFKDGQIKCYVDQYRVLVVPKCSFSPVSLKFGGIATVRFRNVKVAEGGNMNMVGKILTDGKITTHAITFDVNKSSIKPESMGFLNQLAEFMKQNSSVNLEIDGHTDSDGNEASNMKLSQSRSDEVKKQLITMGVFESRLTTKGYGQSKPIDNNSTPEGKANNRRVEFIKL